MWTDWLIPGVIPFTIPAKDQATLKIDKKPLHEAQKSVLSRSILRPDRDPAATPVLVAFGEYFPRLRAASGVRILGP